MECREMWILVSFFILITQVFCDTTPIFNRQRNAISSCRYMLLFDALLRDTAQSYCEGKGGNLAIVRQADDNREVVMLLQKAHLTKAWIGMYVSDRRPTWEGGSSVAFTNFTDNPDYRTSSTTAVLNTGEWELVDGKDKLPFVCSVKRDYMVLEAEYTRPQSREVCNNQGMELARAVHTSKLRKTIHQLTGHRTKRNNLFWVDGERLSNGNWSWSDGSSISGPMRWKPDVAFPNNGPLYIAYNKQQNYLEPLHGHFLLPAVCQCPKDDDDTLTFAAQNDYGKINAEGQYVALFRISQYPRKRVQLEHHHDDELHSDTRYFKYSYHPSQVTHGEAQKICSELGGDLACPRNLQQQSLIMETIKSNVWIGIQDVDEEGSFRCVGDNELLSYSNWYHRFGYNAIPEPDNMTDRMKPGANYVQMLYDKQRSWRNGKWIDRGAPKYEYVIKSSFVCER